LLSNIVQINFINKPEVLERKPSGILFDVDFLAIALPTYWLAAGVDGLLGIFSK